DERRLVPDVDAVLGAQLRRERVEKLRDPRDGPVLVILGVGEAPRDRIGDLRRRAVVDDALPERDRPGTATDQVADDRDDRRLDRLDAKRRAHTVLLAIGAPTPSRAAAARGRGATAFGILCR